MKLEHKIQSEIILYIWNNYPLTRGLLKGINNNSVNAIQGAINKGLGIVKGSPDLEFCWYGKTYFIELKLLNGKLSKEQKELHNKLIAHGFSVKTIYSDSSDEAINYIKEIING